MSSTRVRLLPDNTEEFWADNLRQAREKIAHIQATVDANVKISTHNLLVSGLEQKEIQQLLQKKHSEFREGNGGGKLPDDEIHVDARLSNTLVFLVIATNNPPVRQRNVRWPTDFNSDGNIKPNRWPMGDPVVL
ncbi:hypothetical protein PENNAL_c0015G00158 [Penicillium nalgiovense]|uniref:Uncharacterized protein n=1 Tax=Penicillium nalgiovense TaxID=60175 RepID=A0A1V6YNT2_PENNA|nr:hypothetical protein PENNAL_c0015G00158 [Penicillium nalgiovense]